MVRKLLCGGNSLRETARILNINRKTVVRKLLYWAKMAEDYLNQISLQAREVEFDDLETFEHTKCKPLSVPLVVEYKTRRILGLDVAKMPCKGKLAAISRKKYGPRPDERPLARARLFERLQPHIHPEAIIRSDSNPHYPADVKKYFPKATHQTVKGRKGASTAQGELKKIGNDPIFSLNHTCAMLRAKVSRLFRKTWNCTKRPDRLQAHLSVYAYSHNLRLLENAK